MQLTEYVAQVPLAAVGAEYASPTEVRAFAAALPAAPAATTDRLDAAVNAGSILSFVAGLDAQEKDDVLYSTQFAQRAASAQFNRFTKIRRWYEVFQEILENLGWVGEQFTFSRYKVDEEELKLDAAALRIIGTALTGNQLAILTTALDALKGLADDSNQIELFDFHSSVQFGGNFQIGAVQKADNNALSLALGAFYFKSIDKRKRFLFISWGKHKINFWTGAQKMTLNQSYYDQVRDIVQARLGAEAKNLIAGIPIT
jgi:hypothetical protein